MVWYKARLVVKGYKQRHGIDYDEVFAPIAQAQMKWKIHQLDVKLTFLNDFLEKEVYIEQPMGYNVQGLENKCLRFKKGTIWVKSSTPCMRVTWHVHTAMSLAHTVVWP
ncbi:hypothetical protein PVK06_048270 [Gossypium arboreum]|uniref:Reverse transcriptase Ty1/copia-type domain-containing protein n=1 Tax=Gossypium arboreum TaxID=29729 RepID=A0ABR0MFI9_GOSAR|nr:hypothetical protein PVK06_048270 [Gossypium arboreum]